MGLDTIYRLSVIMNMVDNLTSPMSRITSTINGAVGKIDGLNHTFGEMTKTGIGMTAVGAEVSAAVLEPVEATFETRRALGELKSLGIQDLQAVEQAAKDFSNTFAGTTKAEFITAAYDIKSGIASLSDTGVAEYTKLAGLTAKATKASTGEMTSLFATGYGIYKDYYSDLSDTEFGELFSAGIAKSVQSFKTTGSGMSQAISSLGASATTASVPLEEQLSILGMLQATMSGSEAGTKYKAFLRSATRGGKELGLNFMDANNQLLSMPEILAQLRGKFGETMDAAEKMELQKAFGDTEAVALIDLLYSKTGDLQSNIVDLYDTMGQGTAVTQGMADAMNDTEPGKFEILQQQMQNLKETLGNSILPTVDSFLDKASNVVEKCDEWASSHQGLVKILMILVLSFGALLSVMGVLVTTLGGIGLLFSRVASIFFGLGKGIRIIKGGFDTLRIIGMLAGDKLAVVFGFLKSGALTAASGMKAFGLGIFNIGKHAIVTAATALPGLISSVWSFTAALLANPITWIVIGIIALIAVLILLWQHWDAVSAFLSTTWNSACAKVSEGFGIIKDGVTSVITWITGKISSFAESGRKMVTTLVEGITSVAHKPVEAIRGIFGKVRKLMPFSDAKEGPLSELTLSGRRILETISTGMEQKEGLPADTLEQSFSKMDLSSNRKPVKKINFEKIVNNNTETEKETKETENGSFVDKLTLNVDISKIKDLPMLMNLIKELQDAANSMVVTPEPEVTA